MGKVIVEGTLKGTELLTVMLMDWLMVCGVGVVESVSVIVKLKTPATVGVPEIVALGDAGVNVSPAGSVPLEMVHVYGRFPPAPLMVAL